MLRRQFTTSSRHSGYKILFFGTDELADRVLRVLHNDLRSTQPIVDHIDVVCPPALYSQKKNKKKKLVWQAPTEKTASARNITVYHPPPKGLSISSWEPQTAPPDLDKGAYDIGVVASFGKFLPHSMIRKFRRGMVNVHPSLLPKYRGPSPMQAALANDDKETGVSLIEVHPRVMDGGKILAQLPYKITPLAKYPDLVYDLGGMGGHLLVKLLQNWEYGWKHAVMQDESQVINTGLLRRENSQIVWETMTAKEIWHRHRALYSKEPIYTCMRYKNKNLWCKFLELTVAPESTPPLVENYLEYSPGTMFHAKKTPYIEVSCVDGSRLHVTRFQVADQKMERDTFQFAAAYKQRLWKDQRFITNPTDTKRPTASFIYPKDHERPTTTKKIHSAE